MSSPLADLQRLRQAMSLIIREVEYLSELRFELPDDVGGWGGALAEWCDNVDAALLARAQTTMALSGTPKTNLRLLSTEFMALCQGIEDQIGGASLEQEPGLMTEYVRVSSMRIIVQTATEAIMAGIAYQAGNSYTGAIVGINAYSDLGEDSLALASALERGEVAEIVNLGREVVQDIIDRIRTREGEADEIRDLRQAADELAELGRVLLGQWPELITYEVKSDIHPRLLAHNLYADHDRMDEILTLNPTLGNLGALIPAGTTLRVYSE